MRRTALKPKRATPRRNEGRIKHARIKRPRVSKTALEREHMDRIGKMACLGCSRRPVEVHHLMKCPDKRCRRDHRFVVPLCETCHRGKTGVHGLGSEQLWGERRGIDLPSWAIQQWEISMELLSTRAGCGA